MRLELKKLADQLHLCEFLVDKIEKELKEDVSMRQPGWIDKRRHRYGT